MSGPFIRYKNLVKSFFRFITIHAFDRLGHGCISTTELVVDVLQKFVLVFLPLYECFLPRCMECRRGLAMRILSVRPSVTRVNCDKTVGRSVQIYTPYERTFSLVF